ncbi:MAG: hypothetical protein NTV70_08260 [Acidobacteria bacterium]|nr:hypothetical protein [Acidobacteriota bacterium]
MGIAGTPDGVQSFAVVGIQTQDGNGKFTVTAETLVIGTSVMRNVSFSGTYVVNPDCSGTATTVFPGSGESKLDFVVTSGGASFFAISADKGGNFSGEGRRI